MSRKRTTPALQPAKTTSRRRTAPPTTPATQRKATPHDKPSRRKAVTAPPTPATSPMAARPAAPSTANDGRIPATVTLASPPASKQARLIALLRSTDGADIAQMIAVTGWQPHSVRGAISGVLRKKLGLTVVSQADAAGIRRYRIVDAASA